MPWKRLERDVVVEIIPSATRRLPRVRIFGELIASAARVRAASSPPTGARSGARSRPRSGPTRATAGAHSASATTSATAAAQHLHVVAHDLGGVALGALLVLPLASAQAALNIDLRAFLQVLGSDLAQPAKKNHAMPLGALLLLAALLVLPALAGRDAQIGDRGARRHGAGLGISAEISDQDDLIDSARHMQHGRSEEHTSELQSLRHLVC